MMLDDFVRSSRVAYFSMEIAVKNEIPTYSGGLGVLAGDTLRSAADLELPVVAVTLLSRKGYFRQELDELGRQRELPDEWQPASMASPLDAKVVVDIEERRVWVSAWLYIVQGHLQGRQPVILLDTDLDENHPEDRTLTHYLYGGDEVYRLKQEIVLGIGGMRMLQALGFETRQYHMNEGHSALLAVELLRRNAFPLEELRPGELPYDIPRVRSPTACIPTPGPPRVSPSCTSNICPAGRTSPSCWCAPIAASRTQAYGRRIARPSSRSLKGSRPTTASSSIPMSPFSATRGA